MEYKELGIYPEKRTEHISLLKYSKSSCGVDFLLNTAESSEKIGWFNLDKRYKTDFFEFYFFRKAEGYMLLAGRKILKSATPFPKCYLHKEKWTFDS